MLVRGDFETLELTIAAVHHQELKVLESLARKEDLHALMARDLQDPIPEISEKQRAVGKVTNFSRLYGTLLAGYTVADWQESRFPTRSWREPITPSMTCGRASQPTGPHVEVDRAGEAHEGNALDVWAQNLAGRDLDRLELRGAFLNYPIQSTASDILKLALRYVLQNRRKAS